jgi:two-component system sensor histidine kinase AtoS
MQVMTPKGPSETEAGHEGLSFENMLREYLAGGVVAIDPDGEITALSPEAERTFHLAPSPGKRGLDTLPEPVSSLVREVQSSGQAVVERRLILPFAGEPALTLAVTAMPVASGPDGFKVFVLFRDLASGRKMEHNLRRLDRLASMGTLSASMAHEIKNALVPIRTLIDLLLETRSDNELADTVRRELARIESIVRHMLRFAPPAHPALAPVRLHEILEHSLFLAHHRIGTKVISIQREFHASPDAFHGDDHQLEQAFVNLLLNAVEAIGPEGVVTVRTDLTSDDSAGVLHEKAGNGSIGPLLRVRITDTGTGISPEHMKRIFEPFFTTKQQGTGLGLPVTRRIIAEHGGSIHIDSQPGQGTTFVILLPVGSKPKAQ